MVGHIAFEMQHLSFWGWGDIQERVGYEHLEFERAVWARERTESSMKGGEAVLIKRKQPQLLKAQTGV